MRASSRSMHQPVIDLRVSAQPAQSASVKPVNSREVPIGIYPYITKDISPSNKMRMSRDLYRLTF